MRLLQHHSRRRVAAIDLRTEIVFGSLKGSLRFCAGKISSERIIQAVCLQPDLARETRIKGAPLR